MVKDTDIISSKVKLKNISCYMYMDELIYAYELIYS